MTLSVKEILAPLDAYWDRIIRRLSPPFDGFAVVEDRTSCIHQAESPEP